ncbi:MAG TPA: NADH-quinone oxidoreductase subunit N [Planctomycetota bacterium]|jgi:NADH-quinone oxidoreductase subunit N
MPELFSSLLAGNVADIGRILPECMVVATFLFALVFDMVVGEERRRSTAYICVLGLLVAMCLNLEQFRAFTTHAASGRVIFAGMMKYDQFGCFFRFLLLLGTIISLLVAVHARELAGKNHGEFYLLLVAVCAGGMFLVSSTNLLMIYLSIESLSVVSYAMAGYLRRDRRSAEAGIKYMVYGAMASGLMIFGMSWLYGLGGTLNLLDTSIALGPAVPGADQNQVIHGLASLVTSFEGQYATSRGALVAILALVFAGFLYKIAAVPFHYWSPDVYEGSPTTAAGFFSVVPKAAGFAVLIRVICAFFPLGSLVGAQTWLGYPRVETIMTIVAIASMFIGNLAALGQTNAKRMLAYSSIAHAGYMLAGLTVLDNATGPAAVLFYMAVYLLMNLGAFMVLVAMENVFGGSDLNHLRGAVRREPVMVVALIIFLFSLTGFPPFGGFIGKYLIMLKLADRNHFGMIVIIGFNSVISLYYYMKLAKAVAIDQPEEAIASTERTPFSYHLLAVCQSLALLALFFNFEWLQNLCKQVVERLH